MRWKSVITVGTLAALVALTGCVPRPPAPGTPKGKGCGKAVTVGSLQKKQLFSGGVVRNYYLTVPASYQPTVKTPVVFNFHGSGSNAIQQSIYTQMDTKGAARGYIVVTPDGIGGQWDFTEPSTDFTFTDDLMRYLDFTLCVDQDRLFTAGMSNGAAFSAAVVCHTEIGFDAFASVTALVPACANGTKVPMVAFHGTADPIVNYAIAGPFTASWAERDGCDPTPVETRIEPDIQKRRFAFCDTGLAATLYSIEGGGHTWPGGAVDLTQFGKTTHTIDATDRILAFFASH